MPDFSYTAIARDGSKQAGTLSADDRFAAMDQVEAMGLSPTQVIAASASRVARGDESATARADLKLAAKHVLNFMRQLSNLLASGVSLSRALQVLCRETMNAQAKAVWQALHDRVADGTGLGDAMAAFPRTFAPVHVAMVRAGETGGFLDVVLKQIADFMTRERELRSRVTAAMVYPTVLAVIAVCVVTFLLTWFIPRFSEIFAEFGQSLPLLTRFIQTASLTVRDYGLFVLLGGGVAALAISRVLATESGRRWRDQQVPRLPGIGDVALRFALVRFARMLGTLLGAGVPLVNALRVAREAVGNQVLADALTRTIEQVQQGTPLAQSLGECPLLFGPAVVEMVAVAEESGRLSEELVRMAQEMEGELDRRLRMLVALAEPALLFVMAAVVGTIVIGMLLPVFDLWDAIQ